MCNKYQLRYQKTKHRLLWLADQMAVEYRETLCSIIPFDLHLLLLLQQRRNVFGSAVQSQFQRSPHDELMK